MPDETRIPLTQLKKMIADLPLQLNRDENHRRQFIIREPINVHVNSSSSFTVPHQSKEIVFVFNFETSDWELCF